MGRMVVGVVDVVVVVWECHVPFHVQCEHVARVQQNTGGDGGAADGRSSSRHNSTDAHHSREHGTHTHTASVLLKTHVPLTAAVLCI